MTAKQYVAEMRKNLAERKDITISEHTLKYRAGEFPFLRVVSKDIAADDRVLLIRAAIHGDETSGPLTLLAHLEELFAFAHRHDVKLIVYPLANPAGFESGKRASPDYTGIENIDDDFIRYEREDGLLVDDIRDSNRFKRWYLASELKKEQSLAENVLMHRLIRRDLKHNIEAVIDLHQDPYPALQKRFPAGGAYHYAFGNPGAYTEIVNEIRKIVPVLANEPVGSGQDNPMLTDRNGFIQRYDGSFVDFFYRLGVKRSVAIETIGTTPAEKAAAVNQVWIRGLVEMLAKVIKVEQQKELVSAAAASILPKKISALSRLHLIHTSSPVHKSDQAAFRAILQKIIRAYPFAKHFAVKQTELDPRYLSGSEKERLRKFRQARKQVDWLCPVYGGIGCSSIVRHFTELDLAKIRKNRPVVNGFSDTTFLINYLFFKIRLLTFHFGNAMGVFSMDNRKQFFEILKGKQQSFSYYEPSYKWLTPKPEKNIEGIAIGGNLSSLRELFDVGAIRPKTWRPYILFVEDTEIDIEDLHNFVVSLDEKGMFRGIRALVTGRVEGTDFSVKKNLIYGFQREVSEQFFGYLLAPVISARKKQEDPLYILKVGNLGHNVSRNNMIIPIGARTLIRPTGEIEFIGPFVK